MLKQRFDRADTVRAAAEADLDFDLPVFAQTLRSHKRIGDDDFPDVGVPIAEIRGQFDTWAGEVDPR